MKMIKDVFSKVAALALACFGFTSTMQAVVPAPDGGYPGFNTAEGQNALFNLTTGVANSAVGWYSLFSNTDGSYNTALGAGTLLFNVGDQSTGEGTQNTAVGTAALLLNTTGNANTAVGSTALLNNTTGIENTATGANALNRNTTGTQNTAAGVGALYSNITGGTNTANGYAALVFNTAGNGNTAIGLAALYGTTGNGNTALGFNAGASLTTGDGNVCIGAGVNGIAGESDTTRIRNIWGQPGGTQAVYVDSNGRLGANTSSRRFKEEIRPMDKASEVIYSLKPVSFRYKTAIEPTRPLSFGLVAEDVEQINADLVLRGKDGKVSTVRYEAVNAMLLNEFLKEHKTVQELKQEIAALRATLKEQDSKIQRISDQLESKTPVPVLAGNNY